jgi:hypothetical protein
MSRNTAPDDHILNPSNPTRRDIASTFSRSQSQTQGQYPSSSSIGTSINSTTTTPPETAHIAISPISVATNTSTSPRTENASTNTRPMIPAIYSSISTSTSTPSVASVGTTTPTTSAFTTSASSPIINSSQQTSPTSYSQPPAFTASSHNTSTSTSPAATASVPPPLPSPTRINLYHLLTSQLTEQLAGIGNFSGAQDGPGGRSWASIAAAGSHSAARQVAVARQFRGKVVCNLRCGDCESLIVKNYLFQM